MYDYNNGRFLSVDPFIQAPSSTQSLNPYTYIFNNPLSGTDPTGYLVDCDNPECGNVDVKNIDKISIDKDGNLTATFSDGTTDTITAEAAGAVAADILISNGIGSINDKNSLSGAFTGAISVIGANPNATGQQIYNAAVQGARKFGGRAAARVAAGIIGRAAGILASVMFPTGTASDEEMAYQSATSSVLAAIMADQQEGGDGEDGVSLARVDTSGGSAQLPPDPDDDDPDHARNFEYENPGQHDPSNRAAFNGDKAVLPKDHYELWLKSRSSTKMPGTRWTKVGKGKKAVYHVFRNDNNGKWHWSGSSNGMRINDTPRALKSNHIPSDVKRWK